MPESTETVTTSSSNGTSSRSDPRSRHRSGSTILGRDAGEELIEEAAELGSDAAAAVKACRRGAALV